MANNIKKKNFFFKSISNIIIVVIYKNKPPLTVIFFPFKPNHYILHFNHIKLIVYNYVLYKTATYVTTNSTNKTIRKLYLNYPNDVNQRLFPIRVGGGENGVLSIYGIYVFKSVYARFTRIQKLKATISDQKYTQKRSSKI